MINRLTGRIIKPPRRSRTVKPGQAAKAKDPQSPVGKLRKALKDVLGPKEYIRAMNKEARSERAKEAFYDHEDITAIFTFNDSNPPAGALVMDSAGKICWERHNQILCELTLPESFQWFQVLEYALIGGSQGPAWQRWIEAIEQALREGFRLMDARKGN